MPIGALYEVSLPQAANGSLEYELKQLNRCPQCCAPLLFFANV
jgi:hypothetical protein